MEQCSATPPPALPPGSSNKVVQKFKVPGFKV
jgi:hypothetical protein